MKQLAIGKIQVGSHRARTHNMTHADICPNDVGGLTFTFIADGRNVQRVRIWIDPETVPVLLRQLFGEMSLARVAKHPDVIALARMSVMMADEIGQSRKDGE